MNTTFFQSDDSTLTVPISMVVLSKSELVRLMEQAAEASTNLSTQQTIRLDYARQFKSKLITHGESSDPTAVSCATESIVKRRVSIDSDHEQTVLITKTQPVQCSEGAVQGVRLAHTLSYTLFQLPDWSLNFSVVKSITNPQEFSTRLQEYKESLLRDYRDFASELSEQAFDMILIEMQFNGQVLSKSDLIQAVHYVNQMVVPAEPHAYQQMIYSMAKEIYRDSVTVGKFKERSGFKQLTPSAVELSRTIYFKDVLPTIDQFYITDKIDGQRALLQIVEYFKRSGNRRTSLGAEIISLSDEVRVVRSFDKKNARGVEAVKTILDTEMVVRQGEATFFAFDAVVIRGKKVSNLPFKMRFKEFPTVDEMLRKYKLGRAKTFVKLTKDKYKEQLERFYEEALASEYEIDGIIFTPGGQHYKEAGARGQRRDTEYYNTVSFKWKPVEQSTIDFYVMAVAPAHAKQLRKAAGLHANSSEHLYALCSGVDMTTFKKLNLQFFEGYTAPLSDNSHQYFPIQFAPYDSPHMYLWSSSQSDLGGRVAEFKFVKPDGSLLNKPEIVRMRDDRVNDVRKGEYFGNALRYAELIWHSIKHPLTFEMLGLSVGDLGGYFAVTSESEYFASRAFNSYIKGELIKQHLEPPSLIDLMCGKGQDLARAIEMGFNEITMVDRDIDALYELLQRKYNLRLKTKDASASVHIRQIDFENAYEDIIVQTELPTEVSSAMLNFGVHYLCHDKSEHNKNLPLADLFRLVDHVLRKQGRFLVTCFDGQAVFDLLKGTDEWSTEGGKYSIKKAYTSTELTDLNQAIDVRLPFSGDAYYREYLVNVGFLTSVAAEHGFELVTNESFSMMLKQFKRHNSKVFAQLDDADKQWIGLYSYMIFQKK